MPGKATDVKSRMSVTNVRISILLPTLPTCADTRQIAKAKNYLRQEVSLQL
jgi:hypothetical protein